MGFAWESDCLAFGKVGWAGSLFFGFWSVSERLMDGYYRIRDGCGGWRERKSLACGLVVFSVMEEGFWLWRILHMGFWRCLRWRLWGLRWRLFARLGCGLGFLRRASPVGTRTPLMNAVWFPKGMLGFGLRRSIICMALFF